MMKCAKDAMTFISEYPETCLVFAPDWSRAASLIRLDQWETHTFQAAAVVIYKPNPAD